MNLLILKKFNNYFNRIIKKYEELDDYESASSSYQIVNNINFNPNDGVRTELILGKGQVDVFFDFESTNSADYLVCFTTVPGESGDPDVNTIESRWFITEVQRTRGGQYKIQLKRDSIADFLNELLMSPAYIRKAHVDDTNPLILNDEGVTVNKIKTSEELLKDNTGSSWLVGYMPKNGGTDGQVSVQIPTEVVGYKTIESIAAELNIDEDDLNAALTTAQNVPTYFINDNIELVGWVNATDGTSYEFRVLAGSQNNLTSMTYGRYDWMTHNPTSDCFAREKNGDYWSRLHFSGLGTYWKNSVNPSVGAIKAGWKTWTGGKPFFTKQVYTKLSDYVSKGTLIYKAGTYYKIKLGTITGPTNTNYTVSAVASPFSTICSKFVDDWNTDHASSSYNLQLINNNAGNLFINYNELAANFYLEKVSDLASIPSISFSMSSTRNACKDQVFDMFAIPFDNVSIINGGNTYEGIGDYAQELAVAISEKMSAGSYDLYDLQLLPYCPIPEIAGNGNINVTNLTTAYDYDFIDHTGPAIKTSTSTGSMTGNEYAPGMYEGEYYVNTNVPVADFIDYGYTVESDLGYTIYPIASTGTSSGKRTITISCQINTFSDASHISVSLWYKYTQGTETVHKSIVIYPKTASFTVDINKSLTLNDEMKIEALCNSYRLVSPNYQGSFDFNVAKNRGKVNKFVAYCTYKPYTPYIKVAPDFDWMYGTDFMDCRGLICGGDFSLGRVNSAWESYQLQNKNYQNIFNREIQNLDVQQSIQRTNQYITGGLGIVTGGATGAAAGAVGGAYGAIAGAALGTISSAAGYGADIHLMEQQLVEQRQFAIDKFNLQLGNIQAIPYTITKVSSFDKNSKIWPFLEYYTCTDTEKEALRQKIKYEGMTVGIIDTLQNYMTIGSMNYIKADLIRNEYIIEDSHLFDDIYIELTKGVYA